MRKLARDYGDRAAFLFVYIREAHPEGGWQVASNRKDGVVFRDAVRWAERRDVAKTCCTRLKLDMPVVVDTIDNTVDDLYAGWPERMFVVDRDGVVAYAGAQGPWGFKPAEAERALKKLLRRPGVR